MDIVYESIVGTLLVATIISLLKILHIFWKHERQKRLEEKANHRHYEKLATEEDYTCSLGNSDVDDLSDKNDDVVFEEHMTISQECLVVISYNEVRAVAVCCFRNDAVVEYFIEPIPECCNIRPRENQHGRARRIAMATIKAWSEKWYFAEAVNILCQESCRPCTLCPG